MNKIFVIVLTAVSILMAQVALAQHSSSSTNQKETVINIVVENLVPHENAFDIMPSNSSAIYHLENAARMSMAKMRALNASQETKSSVKLKVKGTDVVDIILP